MVNDNYDIDSACMYYRHDFGLLDEEQKDLLRIEAVWWRDAWGKVREDKRVHDQKEDV